MDQSNLTGSLGAPLLKDRVDDVEEDWSVLFNRLSVQLLSLNSASSLEISGFSLTLVLRDCRRLVIVHR